MLLSDRCGDCRARRSSPETLRINQVSGVCGRRQVGWGKCESVKSMWCTPGRGCGVEIVMNVGFRAIKLAGECRERGSYASREGPVGEGGGVAKSKRDLDWVVEHVTSGTFGGMTHMGTRTMRKVGGLDGNGCRSGMHVKFEFRVCVGDGRWVGKTVRVSKVQSFHKKRSTQP